MADTAWLKQSSNPLFSDLLWSRPENKRHAGKLLIVGGNQHSFAAPASVFTAAAKAGAGSVRVILPEVLRKIVGNSLLEADYAPSNLSGSFSKKTLALLMEHAEWADGVLLAGDFGRNSETAVMLAAFLEKFSGQVTLALDAVDYFLQANSPLLSRRNTLSVINMGKLQKLMKNNHPEAKIRYAMSLSELVKTLADVTNGGSSVITKHKDQLVAASEGRASTTAHQSDDEHWQTELCAYASVWWLQQSGKPFEALTTAVYCYTESGIG